MDALQGASVAQAMADSVSRGARSNEEEQAHQSAITVANIGRNVAPPTVGALMGLATDAAIAAAEEKNPALGPKDPLSLAARNRFSPLGQVVFGRGYVQQPGIPTVSLLDRVINTITGREQNIPENSMFNARGNVFSNVVFGNRGGEVSGYSPTGFETNYGGGSEAGPTDGMTSHGGMESAIGGIDASGYA